MPYTPEQRRALRADCDLVLHDVLAPTPAQEFAAMALWCERHGVAHDDYGDGALVGDFERKIAALLGKAEAVFMPSGIMAQTAAIAVWTETARLPRFGLHPTSHLALHEDEGYAALLGLHAVALDDRLRPLLARDLDASPQPMACVLVELPLREVGGLLPDWDELEALVAAARSRGIPLHMDGARLWESVAHYDRSHAEVAAGFESVYVSVYKGIGALTGALLAGSAPFIGQARLWRRRLGGTLYHLSPLVVSAAMRFDERLALMPAFHRRAIELAVGLRGMAGLRVQPEHPHTNLMHLYFDAPAEVVMQARDAIAAESRCWLFGNVRPAPVPGWSLTELYVGDGLLAADNARVLPLFERLLAALRRAGRDAQPAATGPAP
ncbi:MAG: beta-eliminating lyase-related protein [Burkholderiaceae bacterium]